MENKEIFTKLENIIDKVKLEDITIYKICKDEEKLSTTTNSDNSLSFKVFKRYILLKFKKMKKTQDTIELKILDNSQLANIQNSTLKFTYNYQTSYAKIFINNINDIDLFSNIIARNFELFFVQYLSTEEQFGCCSKYVECSNNLKCVNTNIRLRFSCLYKHNLENNKIFYGKNRNI